MASVHTTCYQSSNTSGSDSIYKSNYSPCNSPSSTGFVSCCFEGHTCGLDGFCHFTSLLVGTSGYYLGGCTDPTYKDPSCASQCDDYPLQDVGYNSSSQLWACCYSNPNIGRNCSSPLNNATFSAPSPNSLFAKSYSVLAAPTQSSTSVVSSATSTAKVTTPTVLSAMYRAYPQEAAGGIAVGVSVGSILIGILLLLFYLRQRKAKKSRGPLSQLEPLTYDTPKIQYVHVVEMQHDDEAFHRTRQLDSVARIPELPGRNLETGYDKESDTKEVAEVSV